LTQKLGQVIDAGLTDHLKEFCSSPFSQSIDYIGRKRAENVYRTRYESKYPSPIFPLWAESVFPKDLLISGHFVRSTSSHDNAVLCTTDGDIEMEFVDSGLVLRILKFHGEKNSVFKIERV
jgi:hypothetical protein